MKKIIALFVFVGVLGSLSAQKVNETVTVFGKDQLTGFTTNVDNGDDKTVADAMAYIFESKYSMKGSNKKGFRVYESYPCSAFGDARYDIYFTTATVGKKKNQTTQVTLVVSNGNMNCITFGNDPRTSRNIVMFLESLPNEVEAYKTKLRIEQLKSELTALNKERESLEKDRMKANDKINNANDEIKKTTDQLEAKTAQIERLQEKFNNNHEASVQEEISVAVKEKESLQKSQSNLQKSLLKLNEEIVNLNKKLETNAKTTEEKEAELKKLQ